MKDKILKIILIISSLPFIGILLNGIYAAFFGVSTGFFGDQSKTYGLEGLWESIVFTSATLLITGVLPICLIYQIFYLIRHLRKKKKSKEEDIKA